MTQEPEKTKLTWEEKVTDILLKAIMTGGIGVGGVNAFWELFMKSDIPKAIASMFIGAGISYGAKMLMPIHKGNEERAERLGNAVNDGINRAGDMVAKKINSVADRYFEAQATECELCKTEGVSDDRLFKLTLEDVFVPLALDRTMCSSGFRELQKEIENFQDYNLDIWQILAKVKTNSIYRQIAILAWGGYGKTTLLRHVAYKLCKNTQPRNVQRFIPVLLLLRKYYHLLSLENPNNLPTIIEQHHLHDLSEEAPLKIPVDWAKNLLKQGNMLIMVDGFDEVPKAHRHLVASWLNTQMRSYPKSVFILTSRPKAYIEQEYQNRLDLNSVLYVRPFNLNQRRKFVEQWYWCQEYFWHGSKKSQSVQRLAKQNADELLTQIETRQGLADLASNPLLLTMIARFHRRYPSAELPRRRVDLYQEICTLQLRDRPEARKLETMLTECEAQTILQMLALEMMIKRLERIDREILLEKLALYLSEQEETVRAAEFLKEVEEISELLVQRDDDLEFSHLSFQEFLAAMEIIRTNQESILHKYFHDDWWKQVILLYVGKVKKPSDLISAALHSGAKELAYACTQETRKQIDEKIKKNLQDLEEQSRLKAVEAEVKNSRYQQLETHLKLKEWEKADRETDRLMLSAVGKESGQFLELDDLRNFPCDELLAIDRLWVKYSKGLYGFSVQKQIYVECGGKLDFNYPSDETWDKFCDRVAWKDKGKYLTYSDLFNKKHINNSGHRPWARRGASSSGFFSRIATWNFSRIATCEL